MEEKQIMVSLTDAKIVTPPENVLRRCITLRRSSKPSPHTIFGTQGDSFLFAFFRARTTVVHIRQVTNRSYIFVRSE